MKQHKRVWIVYGDDNRIVIITRSKISAINYAKGLKK
tara:strand:+ start:770 stop:880 length:111 start_codon:yes stop_codon:yes gene_type:complete